MQRSVLFVILLLVGKNVFAQTERIDSLRQIVGKSGGTARVDALNLLASEISSYDYDLSVKTSQEAYDLAKKKDYPSGMASALLNEAVIEMSIGHDSLSRKKFYECISLCNIAKEEKLKANVFTYLGYTYQNADRLDSAEYFFERASEILKDGTHPQYLSFLYLTQAKLQELK